MSVHVRTNLRETLKYNLGLITTTNGYNRTIRDIGDPPKSPENFKEFPAVNIDFGTERAANANPGGHTQYGANLWIYENQIDVVMDFFMVAENMSLEQETILADVQKYFGTGHNYAIPTAAGVHTVLDFIYIESTPFGLKVNRPNCGIQIIYRAWYRQRGDNPATLA